ncbi:MAG: hypothetical protein HOP33_15100 [Verrucomicrobia bacterium]|nr:hypothetical protein [Verrucomicrobiota bacterium]
MKTNLVSPFLQAVRFLTVLILSSAAYADPLDIWATQQLSTNRFGLSSIVFGNGCYVAAGSFSDYGTIVSSEDGYNWTVRADGYTSIQGAPIWGLKVNFANGRFIAISAWGGTVVSTNGTNWTLGSAPLIQPSFAHLDLYGATYGGGRFVAVGQPESGFGSTVSNIVTSADGVAWTLRRSHPTEARTIVDVAYGAGTYAAIGPNDGFTYTSPTATTWTRRSILGGQFD